MKIDELQEIVCQAHMAGQNNQSGVDPSWSEAFSYWKYEVEPKLTFRQQPLSDIRGGMMIKRYDIDVMPTGKHFPQYELEVEEYEDGMWVKYEDIKHLLERSDNSDYAKCYNCGQEFKIEKELCPECSDFGDGCGA